MFSFFVLRRTSAVAEGVVAALIVAILAGLTGVGPFAAARDPFAGDVLEGVLVVRHGDDFTRGLAVGHTYTLVGSGVETELQFRGDPPDDSVSGQRIRVRGTHDGRQFLVAAGGTEQTGGSTSSGAPVTGVRSIAVVLLNFSNNPTEPYTSAYAAGVAFNNANSVAAYYAETSWGQLTLTGQVFGWYTVPETDSSCTTSSWSESATTAAAAEGVDLAAFDNVVYAFPYVASCPWAGLASMPGRSSWLNGPSAMALRTMAHELGHNFGTHHASSLSCTEAGMRVALSATCTSSEYGDPFSVMGSASLYHHTNLSRGNFDWLTDANDQIVTASGTYTIKPIEYHDPTGVQVLRIPRGNGGTYLTLEFRQPFGASFDTFSVLDTVVNGVTVRVTGDLAAAEQSRLVDATPGTPFFTDAALTVGLTLVDPVSGVLITTVNVSSEEAAVMIVMSDMAPTPAPTGAPAPTATPEPTAGPTPVPTPEPTGTPDPTGTPEPTPGPDPEAPTTPTGLEAAPLKGKRIALSWTASSDNIAVAGYKIFRDGRELGTTSAPGYIDAASGRSVPRTYYVVAFDAAGNWSAPSVAVTVTP